MAARVSNRTRVAPSALAAGVVERGLVPVLKGSALRLSLLHFEPGAVLVTADVEREMLLYVSAGTGSVRVAGETHALEEKVAALVLAGEEVRIEAGSRELEMIRATVGPESHRHAALGARTFVAELEDAGSDRATGARSYHVLLGPHNGSTRATMFVGVVPPGKAPWHYHLYDEIVWVPEGPGRLHLGKRVEELGPGSAFRLRPREAHIVENAHPRRTMAVVGIFTPAGSPSAAYLTPEVAAGYEFAG